MTEKLELTRRRVLGSIVAVGGASAIAGAGTMAYLSDTEGSIDSTVSTGTLDLKVDGGDGAVTTVDVGDVAPGDSASGSAVLRNGGSIDGSVDLVFGAASNVEGDNPGPEGDTSGDGELGEVLAVTVSIGETHVRSGTFDAVFDGTEEDANVPLAAGESKDLTIDWSLPAAADDDVQGDSVSGDVTVELNQTDGQ